MFTFLRDGTRYIVATCRWVISLWKLWGTVAVVVLVAAACALLPGKPDDQIRYSGLILQLLGVGTVIALLKDKTKTMGRLGLWAHIRERWSSRPKFGDRRQIERASREASSTAVGSDYASVWRRAPESASIEERLRMLEANTETLHRDCDSRSKQYLEASQRLTAELEEERRARTHGLSTLESRLDKLGAGGLHIEGCRSVLAVSRDRARNDTR